MHEGNWNNVSVYDRGTIKFNVIYEFKLQFVHSQMSFLAILHWKAIKVWQREI